MMSSLLWLSSSLHPDNIAAHKPSGHLWLSCSCDCPYNQHNGELTESQTVTLFWRRAGKISNCSTKFPMRPSWHILPFSFLTGRQSSIMLCAKSPNYFKWYSIHICMKPQPVKRAHRCLKILVGTDHLLCFCNYLKVFRRNDIKTCLWNVFQLL